MKYLRLVLAILLLGGCLFLNAQVITQIGKENMKIPTGKKPEKPSLRDTKDFHVNVDTATVYYIMIDSAQVAIDNRDWPAAESFFKQALASEPENASNSLILSNLATVQRYQGKAQEALKNYTLALDLTPNAVTVLLNRAALLVAMGNTEQAVADFQRVRDLDDSDAESRYSMGMISLEQRDFKTAEEMFDEIKRNAPHSALSCEGLGLLYKEKGNFNKAIEQLSIVIKAHPTARLLANRADCHLALKHLNDATADIHQAMELDPEDGYLYVLRAKLNKLRYNREDMEHDIEQAVRLGVDRKIVGKLLEISSN